MSYLDELAQKWPNKDPHWGDRALGLKEACATVDALRLALAASRDEGEKLRFALLAQKYAGENQCFCEMSIGNPMYKTHSNSCRIATETLAAYTAARDAAARKLAPAVSGERGPWTDL